MAGGRKGYLLNFIRCQASREAHDFCFAMGRKAKCCDTYESALVRYPASRQKTIFTHRLPEIDGRLSGAQPKWKTTIFSAPHADHETERMPYETLGHWRFSLRSSNSAACFRSGLPQ